MCLFELPCPLTFLEYLITLEASQCALSTRYDGDLHWTLHSCKFLASSHLAACFSQLIYCGKVMMDPAVRLRIVLQAVCTFGSLL